MRNSNRSNKLAFRIAKLEKFENFAKMMVNNVVVYILFIEKYYVGTTSAVFTEKCFLHSR